MVSRQVLATLDSDEIDMPIQAETPDSRTELHGRRLMLVRLVYLALLLVAVGVFVVGLPMYYQSYTLGSIGAEIDFDHSGETLMSPVPGQSAAEAGLQPGSVLLAIGTFQVKQWQPPADVVRRLYGPPGSSISLRVRERNNTERDLTITRDVRGIIGVGVSPETYALILTVFAAILFTGYVLPAMILFARKSDDWLAMFVSLTLVIVGGAAFEVYSNLNIFQPEFAVPLSVLQFIFGFAPVVLFYVFPNGRFVPAWTWVIVPVAAIWAALWQLPPPYAPQNASIALSLILTYALYGGGIVTQIYRYRNVSGPIEQQQTKWVVLGMAVTIAGAFAYDLIGNLVPNLNEPTPTAFRFVLIGQGLESIALLALPIALTFSMLRYRLYDIDLILNRALVYVPLTAILAGLIAVASDLSKQAIVNLLGGQSDISLIVTTLIIVAAFDPIKDALQKTVDRYFRVPEPAKQLRAFGDALEKRLFRRDEPELLQEFLEQAAGAFQTRRAAIYCDGTAKMATRLWDGNAQMRLPIANGESSSNHGELVLGKRENGAPYTEDDQELLTQISQTVARTIEQDRSSQTV